MNCGRLSLYCPRDIMTLLVTTLYCKLIWWLENIFKHIIFPIFNFHILLRNDVHCRTQEVENKTQHAQYAENTGV